MGAQTYVFGVPYYDDGRKISRAVEEGLVNVPGDASNRILLIHYGVNGAKVGPGDYVLPSELSVGMLFPEEWNIIFSGHYHIGQQIGAKFHYIGSAMQHRWDDAGLQKSFVVYDTETGKMERIPTEAPVFKVVTRATELKEPAFVRYVLSKRKVVRLF